MSGYCLLPAGHFGRSRLAEGRHLNETVLPVRTGIHPLRHSGAGRNPPPPSFRRRPESSGLYNTFPRSGNDNPKHRSDRNRTPNYHPAPPSPAACSRRGSTTCIHAGVGRRFQTCPRQAGAAPPPASCGRASMQAGLRRAVTGLLYGLFPTPSTASAACSRRGSTAYIPVGVRPCRRALSPHTGRLRASCPLAAYRTSCP